MTTPAKGQPYPLPAETAGEYLDQLAALSTPQDQWAYVLAGQALKHGAPASIVRSVLLGYIAAVHPDPDAQPEPCPPSVVDRSRRLLARWLS